MRTCAPPPRRYILTFFSWDDAYERELHNHTEDAEDQGTVWFSESNAEDTILDQLSRLEEDGLLVRTLERASRFVDLGTGNGHLLFALRDGADDGNTWDGELVGVDYSETSIRLARSIAEQRGSDLVAFETWNLLSDHPGAWLKDGFDMALDKGTFDAISLMTPTEGAPHPCETYREKVVPLIKPGYFLMLTSCNWTKEELLEWFVTTDGELSFHSEAKYPTFTFGGRTGQSIVTIIFQKRQATQ